MPRGIRVDVKTLVPSIISDCVNEIFIWKILHVVLKGHSCPEFCRIEFNL